METEKKYVAQTELLVEVLKTKTDKEVTAEYGNYTGTATIWIEKERVAEFHNPKYRYQSIPYITVRCGWYGDRTTTYKMLKNGTFSYAKIADEIIERYNQAIREQKARDKQHFNYSMSSKLAESLGETLNLKYRVHAGSYADKVEFQIKKEFTAERLTEFVALLRANGFADLLDY